MGSGTPPPQTHARGQRQALDREWLAYLENAPPDDGDDARNDPRLSQGLDRYARGAYYDAHETWEALWNALPYPSKLMAQALAKLATAAEHARKGNGGGAQRLATDTLAALSRFIPNWAGIDTSSLAIDLNAWSGRLASGATGDPPVIRAAP